MENVNVNELGKANVITVIGFMIKPIVFYLSIYCALNLVEFMLYQTSLSWVSMYLSLYIKPLIAVLLFVLFVRKYRDTAANIEQLTREEKSFVIDSYMNEAVHKFGLRSIDSITHALNKGRNLAIIMLVSIVLAYVVLTISIVGLLFLPFVMLASIPILVICFKMLKAHKYMTEAIALTPHEIGNYLK